MNAEKKGLTAAERAAAKVAAMTAVQVPARVMPPRPASEETTRGVLGRLERTLGTAKRIEKIELDPKRVRPWQYQGRLQDSLSPERLKDLLDTMPQHGQFQLAIVRPIEGDPQFTHEVIDGSRRRMACELLGRKLEALSRPMTDLEAVMVVQSADDQLKHSAYEVAQRWMAWLAAGIVESAAALADKVNVSRGHMSQQLNVGLVPRGFLRCWGDHDRVPHGVYLRLASLVAKAKQAGKLDAVTASMEHRAAKHHEAGQGAKEAMMALAAVEAELRPRRAVVAIAPVERKDSDDRRVLTVVPGKNQVGLKLAKSLPSERQVAFAEALADFAATWLAEGSRRE